MKAFITLLFLVLFAVSACSEPTVSKNKELIKTETKQKINSEYPEKYPRINWTLKNLQGKDIRLSDYQGKPVLLVFWATWCPYCKKLLPGVNRVYEKYKAKGFTVIAMNIREDGNPKAYMKKRGFNFEVALDSDLVAKRYGVNGTPTLIFIDKSGKILGYANFSDPEHPALEYFAKEQLDLLEAAQ